MFRSNVFSTTGDLPILWSRDVHGSEQKCQVWPQGGKVHRTIEVWWLNTGYKSPILRTAWAVAGTGERRIRWRSAPLPDGGGSELIGCQLVTHHPTILMVNCFHHIRKLLSNFRVPLFYVWKYESRSKVVAGQGKQEVCTALLPAGDVTAPA